MTVTMAGLTEQEGKLVKQIEYYFSDVNLIKDKFLKEETTKNDGWVSLDTLLTFNKMKALNATDKNVIEAFRKAESELIEISEDEKQIRRSVEKPLPEMTEEFVRELRLRTVHLKGFPLDATFEDIKLFCEQYGEVESIEMRRTKERNFKGCCFVVYKKLEDAEKAASDDDKFKENGLIRENKVQYLLRKAEYYAKITEKRKKKQEEREKANGKKPEAEAEGEKNGVKVEEGETKSNDDKTKSQRKNAVLKLRNLPDRISPLKVKDEFRKFGPVEFVTVEDNEGYVRFKDSGKALDVLIQLNKNQDEDSKKTTIQIDDHDIEVELLTGDDEQRYWVELSAILSNSNGSSVLKITELPDETSFGHVKDALKEFKVGFVLVEGSDAYVKYKGRQAVGVLKQIEDKNSGAQLTINGKSLDVVLLAGDEEKKCIEKMERNDRDRGGNHGNKFNKRNGHQRGGGYKGGFKRKGGFQQGGRGGKRRF